MEKPRSAAAKALLQSAGLLTGSALAATGGWWLYSRLALDRDVPLPPALDADRTDVDTRAAGRLSYYSDTRASGAPLVLIHSVNAAASAFEMKPLFDRFRKERPVFALDLPGFGFSSRADRVYAPALFTEAILEFLQTQVQAPADVVALSLSCEFAARAARQAPERFASLTLVSPTGLEEAEREGSASGEAGNDAFYRIASQPLWARAFYDLIATRASIHYFLQQSFAGAVPQDVADYSYLSAHQPGAEHAPLYFISGKLFTPRVRARVYERLEVPTLVLFDEDGFVSFERLPGLLSANDHVRAVRLQPTRGLPQFDQPRRTAEVLAAFWHGDAEASFPPATIRVVRGPDAAGGGKNAMPRDESLDSSLALLEEGGYTFISSRCQAYGTDVFETRLLLQKTICMRGREAAELFYDRDRFVRAGAAPKRMTRTLFGQGGVQGLDGEAHTHRKAMFMALMTPEALQRMVDLSAEQWRAYAEAWAGAGRVVLFDEVMELLMRAVCQWAGVPLGEDEVARRTREMADLISSAASIGPHYLAGRLARHDAERWAGGLIQQTRRGDLSPPEGSALARIATYRDLGGDYLDEHDAAVDLLNVLRPTVAVARYVVFCALALHEHPEWRGRLREDESARQPFVQEVRRFYPFFPFAAARVKRTFEWRGYRFPRGTRVLLDLYGTNHDERLWEAPDAFRPERFRDGHEDAFTLIPQGGGDHYMNHRCAGEWLTIAVMKEAVRALTERITYDVPPQNLAVDLARMPALPESRFVIDDVARA